MGGVVGRVGGRERRLRVVGRQLARVEGWGEVVRWVVALHATDPATVFLTVAARLREPGGGVTALEDALYGETGALVRMLAMRRTMFVVDRASAPTVYAAAGKQVAAAEHKKLLAFLAEGGGWDAAWLEKVQAQVRAALDEHGETGGAGLSRLVPGLREQVVVAAGKPYEARQNVASRIIRTMAAQGLIERRRPAGSWASSQFRWANAEPLPDLPVAAARADLVTAWLAAYGPGTEADLKWWTGWSLTEVRKALAAVGAERVLLDDDGVGHVLPGDGAPTADDVPPAATLLPALDPTPMGWRDRDWFLPAEHRAALFDRTGNVGPTVWWGGEVVGGWAHRADGTVATRLLADRGTAAAAAVDAAAERLAAFLADGGVTVTPRFRTPLERELSA
ncbi:Winged helix DNA-binding domain-containing protein [Actinacidiphila alni]|uniref:Winged helix DNA-binding domain-containing protein n=1 Tax=Actinacidiphila alni TaxID=380248 RepID=A0A1I2G5T6_9ACTN|nr:winged helix DNA-binding domain-containing protein [Actinacidiphila alni]SFF12489.1 Winged helix DNA-binding domain-containing protein [Actinacidiphila alni]